MCEPDMTEVELEDIGKVPVDLPSYKGIRLFIVITQ